MSGAARLGAMFVALVLIFVAIGWALSAYFAMDPMVGMGVFFALAMLMNLVSFFFADRIVLAAYRARSVDER